MYKKVAKNTTVLRSKPGFTFTWKITCSYIWVVPLQTDVQCRLKTIETGCLDSVDKITVIVAKVKNVQDFDNWPLNTGWMHNKGSTV